MVNVNNTGDGGTLHRMLIAWDATNDTWYSLGEGIQQDDYESRSSYESQLGVEDGSGATGVGIVSIGVTPDMKARAGRPSMLPTSPGRASEKETPSSSFG